MIWMSNSTKKINNLMSICYVRNNKQCSSWVLPHFSHRIPLYCVCVKRVEWTFLYYHLVDCHRYSCHPLYLGSKNLGCIAIVTGAIIWSWFWSDICFCNQIMLIIICIPVVSLCYIEALSRISKYHYWLCFNIKLRSIYTSDIRSNRLR